MTAPTPRRAVLVAALAVATAATAATVSGGGASASAASAPRGPGRTVDNRFWFSYAHWLAGTHRGHAGLTDLLQTASSSVETTSPTPPEFVAQGDRVMVVGFATGSIKSTKRTFEDHWVFAITVSDGKLTKIREYIDTQALARASEEKAKL